MEDFFYLHSYCYPLYYYYCCYRESCGLLNGFDRRRVRTGVAVYYWMIVNGSGDGLFYCVYHGYGFCFLNCYCSMNCFASYDYPCYENVVSFVGDLGFEIVIAGGPCYVNEIFDGPCYVNEISSGQDYVNETFYVHHCL